MPGKLVVVDHITYRQSPTANPYQVSDRFHYNLASADQPYERWSLEIGEEWKPLSDYYGWLGEAGNVGLVVVKNLEGRNLQVTPTPEERAAINARVIEIGSPSGNGVVWLVPPATSTRGLAARPELLHIRCQSGVARFNLCIIPR